MKNLKIFAVAAIAAVLALPSIDWTMVPASHSVFYTLRDPLRGNP